MNAPHEYYVFKADETVGLAPQIMNEPLSGGGGLPFVCAWRE